MALARQIMIERMQARDPAFDGRFITGVLSTGIYCLPSCPARNPKPENVRFFPSIDKAQANGLRPCKRCRPDDFYRHHDPDRERLLAVVDRLREAPGDIVDVSDLASAVDVGSSKLHDLVRRHFHTTPAQLLNRLRIEAAGRRLVETDDSTTEIAFEVGYASLSAFHENFRRRQGMAPSDYRKLVGARHFTIDLPVDYPHDRMLGYLGRDPQNPTQRVVGCKVRFGTRLASRPTVVATVLDDRQARVSIETEKNRSDRAAIEAHEQVLRRLGLNHDPGPFERLIEREPKLAGLLEGRRGLRVPQTGTPFEAMIWTIVGQQINLAFAFTLYRRAVEIAGEPIDEDLWAPPTPTALAAIPIEALLELQFSRRKAEYLIGISEQIAAGDLDLDRLADGSAQSAEAALLAVRGLGPWSTNYVMMRGLGFEDCVPVGDSGLRTALRRFFDLDEPPDSSTTLALMGQFAPHRSLATIYLWQTLEDNP